MDVLQRANWVDILSLILIIRITYVGSFLGIGKQILPLLFIIFIQVVTFYSYDKVALVVSKKSSLTESAACFIIYLVIIAIAFFCIKLLSRFVVQDSQRILFPIERVGGFIVALLRAVVITGLILVLLLLAPIGSARKAVIDSFSGIFIVKLNLNFYANTCNSLARFGFTKENKPDPKLVALKMLNGIKKENDYVFQWLKPVSKK